MVFNFVFTNIKELKIGKEMKKLHVPVPLCQSQRRCFAEEISAD